MSQRVQVQGICRFSYLSEQGAFQSTPVEADARRAYLFDPARLDQRLALFEHVALPGLRAQTDPDFTMHILMSETMPPRYADAVRDLVANIPQACVTARPMAEHRGMCRAVMMENREATASAVAEFRLDDDDAVAVDFVELLRRDAGFAIELIRRHGRFTMDFSRGVLVILGPSGDLTMAPILKPLWPCGLAIYFDPTDDRSVLDFPHHKLNRRMPVLTQPAPPMYIRTLHDGNDSRRPPEKNYVKVTDEDLAATLRRRFRFDPTHLQAGLARLRPSAV